MAITRQMVADRIAAYLGQRESLAQLVDWAERQVMDGEFESPAVRNAAAELGLADVKEFGLTWEDCQRILADLGFSAHVEIALASGSPPR